MRAWMRLLLWGGLCLGLGLGAVAGQAPTGRALTAELARPVSGHYWYAGRPVVVAGRLYDAYGCTNGTCTLDIRGWERCTAQVGIPDNSPCSDANVLILVDGQPAWRRYLRRGEPAVALDILLLGHQTMTLCCPLGVMLIEPAYEGGVDTVERNPLDALAAALRKRIDEKPELKARVAHGQIALTTFTLVDVDAPSVAVNVAENLSTALINADLPLVERGHIDNLLRELQLQGSGIIDPSTAKHLGEVTGCDLIIVGSIADHGASLIVNARLLETATGKALAAERVEMPK